jgi:hypothetical protein
MTTIVQGLKAYLEAQVTGIGNAYPVEVPQDASYPAWSYQLIDDDQELSHAGGTGFCKARIQIDIMAKETASQSAYGIAQGLAKSVRTKLDGFKGNMNGVQVEYCKTTPSDDWADLHNLPVASFDVMINYILQ